MKLLPVEIFFIIQKYIGDDQQYRMFMNCNKEIFQSIKYQTVYFRKTILLLLGNNDRIHQTFKNFQTLISKVKDKSKQIGLYLYGTNTDSIMVYADLFDQIHHIEVLCLNKSISYLNLSVFSNIYHVELNRLNGITTIDTGLDNVKILSIGRSSTLTTIDLRHVKLQEFTLTECPNVLVLKGINDVHRLNIQDTPPNLEGFELIPNIPYESISLRLTDAYFDMLYHCDLSNLHTATLLDVHVHDNDELSMLCKIQDLFLSSAEGNSRNYPSLPRFYGTSLELIRFNLQSWKSVEFIPNVKKIKIISCINVDPNLSFLANARTISLSGIENITKLISLPCCTELELTSIYALERIAAQPRLRQLTMECPNVVDYEIDGQLLNRVEIFTSGEFQQLSTFRNTREFIFHPLGLAIYTNHSFAGYDQSDLPSSDRIVRIDIHPTLGVPLTNINLFELANLRVLEVNVCGDLIGLSHFHDVHTIQIRLLSESVKEVSFLRNIQVLQFSEVKYVQSLHHLENIDKIMLCEFPEDFLFDGLKGCRVVYSRGNTRLEKQAELYGRGERDVLLFDSNYLEMLGSIEEFYIVHGYYRSVDWQKLQDYDISCVW